MNKKINIAFDNCLSALIVSLVSIPLCIGLAIGSNAPLYSGIIAGIIGGIIVGSLSKNKFIVTAPASGLSIIIVLSLSLLGGNFRLFLCALLLAGVFQIILGIVKFKTIAYFFPNTIIKGMLVAIGIIMILKQIPFLLGSVSTFEGSEEFTHPPLSNTFTDIVKASQNISMSSIILGMTVLVLLFGIEVLGNKEKQKRKLIISIFVISILGILIFIINDLMINKLNLFHIQPINPQDYLTIPPLGNLSTLLHMLPYPDFSGIYNIHVWQVALIIGLSTSLETILTIEAIDKIDIYKQTNSNHRELIVQGIGNICCAIIGGLPLTVDIVRSSANIYAGARTKYSTILNGLFMFLFIVFLPSFFNKIPFTIFAAVLMFIGYKLIRSSKLKMEISKDYYHIIPFIVTIISILLSNLIIGIALGVVTSIICLCLSNFRANISIISENNNYLFQLRKDVSFLHKPLVRSNLESIPNGAFVIIDTFQCDFMDLDILEEIEEFIEQSDAKNLQIEIRYNAFDKYYKRLTACCNKKSNVHIN
ncbi:MAG: SulP family inorganic anion transporter [Phycisphaerales bacterium]|nr:SulP family inorganic anion transporter [Phycisphaerales bacterium]